MIDLKNKVVLVTGGTMGIGLAGALAYARAGAHTIITHRWGSADEDEVRSKFEATGGPAPLIVEADVVNDDDTEMLLDQIAAKHDGVDVFVSNAAFAHRVTSVEDYSLRALHRSIDYSAWPMWSYSERIHTRFGRYPRYIIGLSSDGPDGFIRNYDFVAISKSVLETMCRYLALRLRDEGVRVNVVRSRLVHTPSFDNMIGESFHEMLEALGGFEDCYVTPEEVGDVLLALGCGLLDAVSGQVIMADRNFEFFDNLMGITERAEARGAMIWKGEKKHDSKK